jgi:hypothetical protein
MKQEVLETTATINQEVYNCEICPRDYAHFREESFVLVVYLNK